MSESKLQTVVTPEGRVINESLFIKDSYKDERTGAVSKPEYKVELALDDNDTLAELDDAIFDAAIAEFGPSAEADLQNGLIDHPFLSGDKIAADREAKGKKGDAYKGKVVIRAHTSFNKNGSDADGGVCVVDESLVEVDFSNRSEKIYAGMYGMAAVQPKAFTIGNRRGVTLYLSGFQRSRDGDRLGGSFNPQAVFKPVGRAEGAPVTRRRRAG